MLGCNNGIILDDFLEYLRMAVGGNSKNMRFLIYSYFYLSVYFYLFVRGTYFRHTCNKTC